MRGALEPLGDLLVASPVAFEPCPVAIYLSGVTVDAGIPAVEFCLLIVVAGRPGLSRTIMLMPLSVVCIGSVVMPHIEMLARLWILALVCPTVHAIKVLAAPVFVVPSSRRPSTASPDGN